jgi:hypothetical protein
VVESTAANFDSFEVKVYGVKQLWVL